MLLGALWATVAARSVRRRLKREGVQARVSPPRHLGPKAGLGVSGALQRLSPTCLERALVQQAWLVSQGSRRDVVIGVPADGMRETGSPAHAWVDGTDRTSPLRYRELHRLAPPGARRG